MERIKMVRPKWIRLPHRNGKFAGSYDPDRDVILFVDRGGTITYDLALLREQAKQNNGAIDITASTAR